MATSRERVQSLDARLRELEERFISGAFKTAVASSSLPDVTNVNIAEQPRQPQPPAPGTDVAQPGYDRAAVDAGSFLGAGSGAGAQVYYGTAVAQAEPFKGGAKAAEPAAPRPEAVPVAAYTGTAPPAASAGLPSRLRGLEPAMPLSSMPGGVPASREHAVTSATPAAGPAPAGQANRAFQTSGRPPLPKPTPPSKFAEVPLRLYREGLPHRDLGPPQSVWEADKNAAVVALAGRVQQLEQELQQQQQQRAAQQHAGQGDAGPVVTPDVMPPPPLDLLPVPRTVLGGTSHANVAAYDGIHAGGPPPAPVKYYPPPPVGQPPSAEAALVRLQAAQGAQAHARAFAASVAASSAATVPSVMMTKRQNENVRPGNGQDGAGDADVNGSCETLAAAGEPARVATGGNTGPLSSTMGVSFPVSRASTAASAAASVHVAALREAGPLQPAGPYPMVSAALAVGTPGTGGSTWEQAKMRALISLEQQRDMLRAQLEEYRNLESRHRRQILDLREEHRKELQQAAGSAGSKLKRLMGSAWATYARRLLVLRVSRALHFWSRIAKRNRRLVWAAAVWRQRELSVVFAEWHMLAMANRHERQVRHRALARYQRTVLKAWAAAAEDCRRLRRLERRAAQARRRRLLAAWAGRAAELRCKRLRLQGAEAQRRAVLLRHGWRGLAAEAARGHDVEALLKQRLARAVMRTAFRTWAAWTRLCRRLHAVRRRATVRSVLRGWAAIVERLSTMRRKLGSLAAIWRRRQLARLLQAWGAAARQLAQLGASERALRAVVRRQLLATALTCLRLGPRERAWTRIRGVVAMRAWRATALRAARNRRIVLVRKLSRGRATLAAVYEAWRLLAKARSVQLHLLEIHRLQELEPTYEHQMELVRQDRAAVQSHMRALMTELNFLRAELLRGFVMSAEGGLLGKPLRWRSLPPDPGQWLPQPRSRHSTLCLRALQLPPAPPPGASLPLAMHSTLRASLRASGEGLADSRGTRGQATGQWQHLGTTQVAMQGMGMGTAHVHHADVEAVVPDVAGVLVVFGGINEEEWFRDVHVLELTYSGGGIKCYWHEVEVEAAPEPAAGVEAGTQRATWPEATGGVGSAVLTGKLPLTTRRDHAACVTSPNQFVVVGGFDGNAELMDINAVTVRAAEDSAGWAATVRVVAPRNRTPPGRSHHTVTAHLAGRSLYVFGGYASSRGTLNEFWAFHLDHHEWWQPNTTGDQPSPRRNHVAVLVGGQLYVHGGFNGTECLGDTWFLDPQTWHWERLRVLGSAPRPRRGHAADVVDDRYLVVHGGYDGSDYLTDGAVLDTVTGEWRDLAAAGGPEDMPTARAHHTLTLVGHVMVALGGSGAMGPLLDMHLLESPPLVAGLAQQYRLMALAAQLSATQAGMADTEAALAVTRHRADTSDQQLQVLRDRSSELLARHNRALADIDRLKGRLAAEALRVVAAEAATAEAQLALATAERRLRRTREGGKEVAEAARDMHDTVCDLREEVARLRSQLLETMQQQSRESSQLAATTTERQLLQQQVAGAQQEAALLRGMLATAETEFRTALDRQRGAAEAELAAAAEHAKQLAVAAAAAAGGAAAAGTAADMDLVALHQLATATARAETAELRLHAMEREYGGLQADLANVKRQLQQQRQARDAAEERAAASIQHMHASELRYQMQVEDLQRQLIEAQREQWRQDLGLMPPRKRAATQQDSVGLAGPPPQQPSQEQDLKTEPRQEEIEGHEKTRQQELDEARRLLLSAQPPAVVVEEPNRRSMVTARVSAMLDPMDPQAHFTVQHIETLLVEDPALEVLPEVARLLQLQRRVWGQG